MAASSGFITLLALAMYIAAIVVPIWRLLSRLKIAGAWSFLALIPIVNLIMLWVLAFSRWPIDSSESETAQ